MAVVKSFLKRSIFGAFFGRYAADSDENRVKKADEKMNEYALTSLLGPFESYVVTAQSIFIWERPMASCAVLLLVNALFWLAVNSNIKFYFVVAATMAFVHIYRTWTNQIWPEIRVPVPEGEDTEEWTPVNPQVFSVPEISRYLGEMSETAQQWSSWLVKTRQKQPGMFCILTSCTLAMIGFIGCYVTGVFQAYFTIMAVMLGPGFFVHIYPVISHYFSLTTEQNMDHDDGGANDAAENGETEDQELEEFMPAANEETLDFLARAVEAPLDKDSASSSIIASQEFGIALMAAHDEEELLSLQVGLGDLPSYNHVDRDDDDEDEDEQDFVDGNGSMPATVPPLRRLSESPEIRFVPSYFDDDSEDVPIPPPPSEALQRTSASSSEERQMPRSTLVSRQSSSSPSDVDASDYEVLSESELS